MYLEILRYHKNKSIPKKSLYKLRNIIINIKKERLASKIVKQKIGLLNIKFYKILKLWLMNYRKNN